MRSFFQKIRTFAVTHKKTSIAIGIILILIGWFTYKALSKKAETTTYVLGTAEKTTIVSSITGSGQVAAGRTLDLKPQASGDVVYVGVTPGQKVSQGALLVQLDASDALKSVRDAEASLRSAQISMEKLTEPADKLTILQSENSLAQAKANLQKSYDDGFTDAANAYLDLPTALTGINQALYNTDISPTSGQWNIDFYKDSASVYETAAQSGKAYSYAQDAEDKYKAAKAAYDISLDHYKSTDRSASPEEITALISETYSTARLVGDAIKSMQNLIQYYQSVMTAAQKTSSPKADTYLSSIASYSSKVNNVISTMLSIKTEITNNITGIEEKELSLEKLKSGAEALDVESQQLSLTRAQNSLQDAKETLANYYVRAPFGGTIAKVTVKRGDPASSGTAAVTLITTDQVVDIPLNEVDISKVKLGQKATLTFDAIDGLTLTGKVASMDTVGTVSQGVVNYTVTIAFDTTDERVKPGMSATASIITDVHADVIAVPSGAVKSGANGDYVLVFNEGETPESGAIPSQVPVTVGISDDTNTEILSGLTDGQAIVARSITASASTTSASSAPSLLGGSGARTGGNATFRAGAGVR